MESSFLVTQVKRTNRNRLIRCVSLIGVVGWFFYCNRTEVSGYFSDPPLVNSTSIENLNDVSMLENHFVNVSGSEIFDTGVGYESVRKNKRTGQIVSRSQDSQFHFLRVGDRILVVKAKNHTEKTTLSGRLSRIPASLSKKLIDPVAQARPQLASQFMPMMLDTSGSKDDGMLWAVFGVLALLVLLWRSKIAFGFLASPGQHPAMMQLSDAHKSKLSELEPTGLLLNPLQTHGKYQLGKSWLLLRELFDFRLILVDDVIWAYKKVTTNRVYGIIPLSRDYAFVIHDRFGVVTETPIAEAKANRLMEEIAIRQPKIIFGYTDELAGMWGSNAKEFINGVEAARNGAS